MGAILLPQDKGQSRTTRLGAAPVHSGPLILLGWPKQQRNTCKYTAKSSHQNKKELYCYDSSTEQKSHSNKHSHTKRLQSGLVLNKITLCQRKSPKRSFRKQHREAEDIISWLIQKHGKQGRKKSFFSLFFSRGEWSTSKHREKQNGKECGVQACERREAKHKGTGASLAL